MITVNDKSSKDLNSIYWHINIIHPYKFYAYVPILLFPNIRQLTISTFQRIPS